jgi:branched-chain amino acid transport system substrate-binding protein
MPADIGEGRAHCCANYRQMKRFLAALALVAIASWSPNLHAPAAAADVLDLYAILPMTGPAAFLGQAEARNLTAAESLINKSNGIRGRQIKFTVLDDQTNPQVAVQLMHELIARKVQVVIGPTLAATCDALSGVVAGAGPVDYCLSPSVQPPTGSFQFTNSVGSYDLVVIALRYMKLKGWTNFATIATTDATGLDFDRQLEAALRVPEFRSLRAVGREHYGAQELSVAAQIARIKSAQPQALIVWTTGTQFSTVLRAMRDGGLEIPVVASAGNMNYAVLSGMSDLMPPVLLFPGMRATKPEGTLPGPIRDAQETFYRTFAGLNIKPDYANVATWDSMMVVIEALRALGPDATAAQIRDWIGKLHGYAGINGIYDYRDGSQRGIGQLGALMLRWDPVKKDYTVESRPGGSLR